MDNMPFVQQGLLASGTGKVHLAHYQESRIRHFHRTLGHAGGAEVGQVGRFVKSPRSGRQRHAVVDETQARRSRVRQVGDATSQ